MNELLYPPVGLYVEVFVDEVFGEVGGFSFGYDLASVHDEEVVGEFSDEIEVLFDDEDGHVFGGDQVLEYFSDLLNDVGLDAFGGFVEDEEFGVGGEGSADGELLLLSSGEVTAAAAFHFVEYREEFVDFFEDAGSLVAASR